MDSQAVAGLRVTGSLIIASVVGGSEKRGLNNPGIGVCVGIRVVRGFGDQADRMGITASVTGSFKFGNTSDVESKNRNHLGLSSSKKVLIVHIQVPKRDLQRDADG